MNRLRRPDPNYFSRPAAVSLLCLAAGMAACSPAPDEAPESTTPAVKYEVDELPSCNLSVQAVPGVTPRRYKFTAHVENMSEPAAWSTEGVDFNFGDGSPSTGTVSGSVEHIYSDPGEYRAAAYIILDVVQGDPSLPFQDGEGPGCFYSLTVK